MADDQSQRPYRSSDSIARAPAKPSGMTSGGGSGNDPLAELARLIGQTDPFAEFGRTQANDPRAVAPPTQNYYAAPPAAPLPHEADPHAFEPTNFSRQPLGGGQLPPGADLYQGEHANPAAAQDDGYEDDGYPDQVHRDAEHDDFYDKVAPNRRRMSIMVVAGIFALAVIGSAGALGYRVMFGKSGSSGPPPVIKAETAPSKIVPASNSREPQSNKLITDRVNERGQGEKLVSREEQPIDIKDKAGTVIPPVQDQASTPVIGSGVVSPDAKRVRTIAIHPDQAVVADATPASAPARTTSVTPPKQATSPAQQQQQQTPPRAAGPPAAAEPEAEADAAPPKRLTTTRVSAPAPPRHAAAASNAPLSLSPDVPVRTPPRAAAPVRTASAPAAQTPPAAASGGSGYAVQVSSQRSEAEAQAAFRSLQGKYPAQLGGKQAMIHKVNLGAKGIYYRALVGPFATGNEATELCSALKAAGASCLILRN